MLGSEVMKTSSKALVHRSKSSDVGGELPASNRLGSVALLDRLLADTVFLSVQAQAIHWNCSGPEFPAMHLFMEARYKHLIKAIDKVAERIRAVGALAPAALSEWIELSDLEDIPLSAFELSPASALNKNFETLRLYRKSEQQIVEYLRRTAIPRVKELEDPVTEDLLIGRLGDHEKSIWMVSSMLGELVADSEKEGRSKAA